MDYFDFHQHSTLKSTLREGIPYDVCVPVNAVSGIVGLCTDLPQIVASQASVSKLKRFDKKVVGVALYAVESVIAGDKTLREVGAQNKKLSKYLSVTRLTDIESNKLKAFDYVTNILLPVFEQKPEFHILRGPDDFSKLDPGKINIFFTIEGSHTLCNQSNTFFHTAEIIQNLDILLSRVKVLSINPTHLQHSNICTQAYGIQLTDNSAFIPSGNGLPADGEAAIQACFERDICVDIKHMSLVARKQLFDKVAEGEFTNPQPIICTHAGFTGISSDQIRDYVIAFDLRGHAVKVVYGKPNHIAPNDNDRRRPAPTFNASSINLYDEEIVAIVKNDGLIGLSLDRRICGFVSQYDEDPYAFYNEEIFLVDKEFFSLDEFRQLGIARHGIGGKVNDAYCNVKDDLLEVSNPPSRLQDFHREHVMLQLKHFLQVCVNNGIPLEKAQSHICIGSDFDGIINPLYCAMTVDELRPLKTYIRKNFKGFLGQYTDSKARRDQLDIPRFLDQLFYENGVAFVKRRMGVEAFA